MRNAAHFGFAILLGIGSVCAWLNELSGRDVKSLGYVVAVVLMLAALSIAARSPVARTVRSPRWRCLLSLPMSILVAFAAWIGFCLLLALVPERMRELVPLGRDGAWVAPGIALAAAGTGITWLIYTVRRPPTRDTATEKK